MNFNIYTISHFLGNYICFLDIIRLIFSLRIDLIFKKTNQAIFFILLLALGFIYTYFIHLEISIPKRDKSDNSKFSFTINSKINQTINLHIATKDKLNSISCNETPNHFHYYSKGYDYKQQEEVKLKITSGMNHCQLKTLRSSTLKPILKQKISFIDYIFLFIFFITPLFHLLFKALIWSLNKIWRNKNV